MTANKWSYDTVKEWDSKCLEEHQSPINIDTELVESCKELCSLEFMYNPSPCKVEFTEGQHIRVLYDSDSGVLFKNTFFKLKEITIHTPSLHKIDNNDVDCEMCLIHSASDSAYDDNGLIISCLFNQGNYYGKAETFLNQFINEIKINATETVDVSPDWSADMLIPDKKSFFLYKGSIPFPPCSKNMNYIVMDTIGNIGPSNLSLLQRNLGKNIRPIKTLDGRQIYYNSGKVSELTYRDVQKSNNKYLRCKKKKTYSVSKTTSSVTKKQTDVQSMNASNKTYIRNIISIITYILIFMNAFFLTKYLFRNNIAQSIIVSIVGTDLAGGDDIINQWSNSSVCETITNTQLPSPSIGNNSLLPNDSRIPV